MKAIGELICACCIRNGIELAGRHVCSPHLWAQSATKWACRDHGVNLNPEEVQERSRDARRLPAEWALVWGLPLHPTMGTLISHILLCYCRNVTCFHPVNLQLDEILSYKAPITVLVQSKSKRSLKNYFIPHAPCKRDSAKISILCDKPIEMRKTRFLMWSHLLSRATVQYFMHSNSKKSLHK